MEIALAVYAMVSLMIGMLLLMTDIYDISDGIMMKHIIFGILFFPMTIVVIVGSILIEVIYQITFSGFGNWVSTTAQRIYKPIKNFMNIKITKKGD